MLKKSIITFIFLLYDLGKAFADGSIPTNFLFPLNFEKKFKNVPSLEPISSIFGFFLLFLNF